MPSLFHAHKPPEKRVHKPRLLGTGAAGIALLGTALTVSTSVSSETLPFKSNFQLNFLHLPNETLTAEDQELSILTALPLLKFGKITAFADSEIFADNINFDGERKGFVFSTGKVAAGLNYKSWTGTSPTPNNTLAEARLIKLKERTYDGLGFKTYYRKQFDGSSLLVTGEHETGLRDNTEVEDFDREVRDANGVVIGIENDFRLVDRKDKETKTNLSAQASLTNSSAFDGTSLNINASFFKHRGFEIDTQRTNLNLTAQQRFGKKPKFNARAYLTAKFSAGRERALDTAAFKPVSGEASLNYPLIDTEDLRFRFEPGLRVVGPSSDLGQTTYRSFLGVNGQWDFGRNHSGNIRGTWTHKLNLSEAAQAEGAVKNTGTFTADHSWYLNDYFTFFNRLKVGHETSQYFYQYEPHIQFERGKWFADAFVRYDRTLSDGFQLGSTLRSVFADISYSSNFRSKPNYEFYLSGRVDFEKGFEPIKEFSAGVRLDF